MCLCLFIFFFFNDPATTEIYTPFPTRRSSDLVREMVVDLFDGLADFAAAGRGKIRSEEHTSELQSLTNLVCRLLLEKKKKKQMNTINTKAKQHNYKERHNKTKRHTKTQHNWLM